MFHSDASDLLNNVEIALDKVTQDHTGHSRPGSFTGRLIGTLTRTVKYIADVSSHFMKKKRLLKTVGFFDKIF